MDEHADDAAVADAPSLVLTFDPPIKIKQATYDSMTLEEPTAKMVRQAEGLLRSGINAETLRNYQIQLVVNVSRWPREAVEEMPITQLDRAGSFLARFTNLGLLTGGS